MYHKKTILITGASSGLGRTIAKTYAKNGGRIINISRDISKMSSLQNRLNQINSCDHLYFSADVSNYKHIRNIQNTLHKKNIYPDVVINNAAGNFISRTEDLTYNGWNKILDIVLKGTMNITLEFGKKMIEQSKHGIFVNISTTYAETGSGFVVPSSVAKAGCNNLTKSFSLKLDYT